MPTMLPPHESEAALLELFTRRIALLDGAMGTMIQRHPLTEADFRGERFKDHGHDLKGNNDLLSITRPDIIKGIHRAYFEAGSDIVETNTFSTTTVSQADYALEDAVREINLAGAKVAREAAEEFMAANPGRRVFVAGSVGPTNRTASMSPDVNNPGYRAVTFDGLVVSYSEQIEALLDGGVDLLLLETVFDTLNLKAAIFACEEVFEKRGMRWPIILSVTITDASGRTLSGQTVEAFWNSVRHSKPLAVGINCALGAAEMRPYIEELSHIADCYISCYPNAGLPNAFGGYDQSASEMAALVADFASEGWINVVGGCCGSTPEHIAAIAEAVRPHPPRKPSTPWPATRLSGLEALSIEKGSSFMMVGERTNVTGSPRFSKLIIAGDYETALSVARQQVESGANILDVNVDEGMLDSEAVMETFLNLLAADPEIKAAEQEVVIAVVQREHAGGLEEKGLVDHFLADGCQQRNLEPGGEAQRCHAILHALEPAENFVHPSGRRDDNAVVEGVSKAIHEHRHHLRPFQKPRSGQERRAQARPIDVYRLYRVPCGGWCGKFNPASRERHPAGAS
jgi:5-methyltetrahydrofolate--homocysteine methyltransferase